MKKVEIAEVIKPEDFNLNPETAKSVENAFAPKIAERNALAKQYEEIINSEMSEELSKRAKELSLKLVKVRTGIAKIHKAEKAFSRQYGLFVDAWKNKETLSVQQMEEILNPIADHYHLIEKKRLEDRQKARVEAISPYLENAEMMDFATMENDVWEIYFEGKKRHFEDKQAAEAAAKEERRIQEEKEKAERIEAERKSQELIEAQRKENERLRKEAAAAEEKARKEREAREAAEEKARKEAEAIRLEEQRKREAAEEKARKEAEKARLESEAKMKAIQDKLDAAKREREAKEAAEKKALAEAEAKKLQEQEEIRMKIEEEANKADKEKIKDLIANIRVLGTEFTFKSKKNKQMYLQVGEKLEAIAEFISNN